MYVYIYFFIIIIMKTKLKTKMKSKQQLFYKKESERTKKEKLCRNLICFWVTIFAAVMWFLLMNANINLADAESDFANTMITNNVN